MRRARRLRFSFPFQRFVRPRIRFCPFLCGSIHRWAGLPALSAGFPCLPNQNSSGKSAFFLITAAVPHGRFTRFPILPKAFMKAFRTPDGGFSADFGL